MKRLLSIAAVAVVALVLVQCDELVGDRPTNVAIEAVTDSTVKITWTAPAGDAPDKYSVKFMETGTTSYVEVGGVNSTEYTHNPVGKTGKYLIVAVYGSTEYEALTAPTTAPIATTSTAVSELNAAGNAGYGWTRATGAGATYSMTQASNAAAVDFYITDFAAGYAGPTYSIASPDLGPTDPGNVVPTGSWHVNSVTNPLSNEQSALPTHSTSLYSNSADLAQPTSLHGCYTQDGFYALVKLEGLNVGSGTVNATTYFQLVEGLRLIQH